MTHTRSQTQAWERGPGGGGGLERTEKIYLKVVLLLSSSGVVGPSFEVALDMEEVEPCSQSQWGTFLEHKTVVIKKKKTTQKIHNQNNRYVFYLEGRLDYDSPCCLQQQEEEEDPGRSHSVDQGVGMHSWGEQPEVDRNRSSY